MLSKTRIPVFFFFSLSLCPSMSVQFLRTHSCKWIQSHEKTVKNLNKTTQNSFIPFHQQQSSKMAAIKRKILAIKTFPSCFFFFLLCEFNTRIVLHQVRTEQSELVNHHLITRVEWRQTVQGFRLSPSKRTRNF